MGKIVTLKNNVFHGKFPFIANFIQEIKYLRKDNVHV